MAILTDGKHTADFVVSEANNYRSRGKGTVVGGADGLEAGTILGKVGDNHVAYDPAPDTASDGADDVTAILYEAVPAGETVERTLIERDAEVNGAHLVYQDGADDAAKATVNAALAGLGIIVR